MIAEDTDTRSLEDMKMKPCLSNVRAIYGETHSNVRLASRSGSPSLEGEVDEAVIESGNWCNT